MADFLQLYRWKEFILDLIWPKECLACGREGSYLCQQCLSQINLNTASYCVLCHRKTPLSQICANCKISSNLQSVFVAVDYNNDILQRLIHNFKYNHILALGEVLSSLLVRYLEDNSLLLKLGLKAEEIILVPVPLHPKRYLARGFNQSDYLAEGLRSFYKLEKVKLLTRKINTPSQIDLKRSERQQNVKDAFILNQAAKIVKNKKIILIDDVVTTGSTLNECAQALANAGYNQVYGLVLAQRKD